MNKTVLLFSGQGSQVTGMGYELYKNFDIAKEIFKEAGKILDYNLKEICFVNKNNELAETKNSQIAIFVMDYIRYQIYNREIGLLPCYSAGLSLGEITALTCSGAMKFEDALKLVKKRGQFMQEAAIENPGSMLVIHGLEAEALEQICKENSTDKKMVNISNYNSPTQLVISGHDEIIDKIRLKLDKNHIRVDKLNVNFSFHSPLMKDASKRFSEELKRLNFYDFKFPVISNVTGKPYKDKAEIEANLSRHMLSPVRWSDSMMFLKRKNIKDFIELGETDTLSKLVKKVINDARTCTFHNQFELDDVKYKLNGLEEYDKKKMSYLEKAISILTCTKNYNDNLQEYDKGIKEPYIKLRELHTQIENTKSKKFDDSFFKKIHDVVIFGLNTKKVRPTEIENRLKQLEDIYHLKNN
ncbi:malonyl CoA-acyl carrier protein transacylase [Clostridium botulinum]|uniref:ACP S-malonyltransferase n=1 Tax=Clostridium botulinum TaxID=1491 RepID=UPI00067C467A|nr:ACP S-malonyltransferase [Clostridium botulinum]MBN3346603.1 malonyl CoA-acyl carrier protein transacylase [Clostridium botulinum]